MQRLATETALPVASPASNGGAASGSVPAVVGKVTPVRYDGKTRRGRKRNVRTFAHFLDSRRSAFGRGPRNAPSGVAITPSPQFSQWRSPPRQMYTLSMSTIIPQMSTTQGLGNIALPLSSSPPLPLIAQAGSRARPELTRTAARLSSRLLATSIGRCRRQRELQVVRGRCGWQRELKVMRGRCRWQWELQVVRGERFTGVHALHDAHLITSEYN